MALSATTATRLRNHPHGPHLRPENSLFILELDDETFASYTEYQDNLEQWQDYYTYLDEAQAEGAWLRAAENDPVYAWEHEMDERRAFAYSFGLSGSPC